MTTRRAYKAPPLPETYRGFKRLRQERNPGGFGTHAVCEVPCGHCGRPIERNAMSIRVTLARGGKFQCSNACKGDS